MIMDYEYNNIFPCEYKSAWGAWPVLPVLQTTICM